MAEAFTDKIKNNTDKLALYREWMYKIYLLEHKTVFADVEKLLINDSFQYPMNIAKVNAAKIVKHGDYVFFLMLGKYDDREEASDEERLEFAKEEVGKVENIINKFFE